MKRAIKFRGKRLDNGKWIYGDLHQFYGRPDKAIWPIDEDDWIEVDPATVGQYTGVNDEHGTNVFEGDIIRHGDELFVIVFGDGCFWRKGQTDTMELHTILGMGEFEILGNIHDNVELVKSL